MNPVYIPGTPEEILKLSMADRMTLASDLPKDTQKYTIFLVEDDYSDRDDIVRLLARSQRVHNVHWFVSGDDMLKNFVSEGYFNRTLIHNIPTLIMLDITIPGTDGLEVLKRLKDNPLTKDIPVVIITGATTDEKITAAFRNHANAFISKPLSLERIHEVMFTGNSWPGTKDKQTA
jgi:CheY-like chemotaxis protein